MIMIIDRTSAISAALSFSLILLAYSPMVTPTYPYPDPFLEGLQRKFLGGDWWAALSRRTAAEIG